MTQETAKQSGTALEMAIIFTRRMEEQAAFYQKPLEIGESARSPDYTGIQTGPVYLCFDQEDWGEGRQSCASLWFNGDDIQETFERLKEAGRRCGKSWGGHLAAVCDPDGTMIDLTQREF